MIHIILSFLKTLRTRKTNLLSFRNVQRNAVIVIVCVVRNEEDPVVGVVLAKPETHTVVTVVNVEEKISPARTR